jgi:hypothetical protein
MKDTEEENPQLRQKVSNHRHKSINFATGVLIQKWCRHQYLKALIPAIMVVWYYGGAFLATRYEKHATEFVHDELSSHNCTIVDRSSSPGDFLLDCRSINLHNQYIEVSHSTYYEVTVNCTVPDAHFYYPKDYWGINDFSFFYQIIVNFFLPLIFTYFIYETLYLSLYDCVILVPDYDHNAQRPIIRYADGVFRVSWFILRDFYHQCCVLPSALPKLKGRQLPGIRVGYLTSVFINIFAFLAFMSAGSALFTRRNSFRCMDQPESGLDQSEKTFIALSTLCLLAALIACIRYYYKLFFLIKDIELLATEYSEEFVLRRYSGIRNLFDLIPLLIFPLLGNIFYYFFWVFPNFVVFVLVRCVEVIYFSLGRSGSSATEGSRKYKTVEAVGDEEGNSWKEITISLKEDIAMERGEEGAGDDTAEWRGSKSLCPSVHDYFSRYVFDLDHRWWCSWFIREVEVSDCVSGKELTADRDL